MRYEVTLGLLPIDLQCTVKDGPIIRDGNGSGGTLNHSSCGRDNRNVLAPWVRGLRVTWTCTPDTCSLLRRHDTRGTFMVYGCTATDKSLEGVKLEMDNSNGPSAVTAVGCPADSRKDESIKTRIIGFEWL